MAIASTVALTFLVTRMRDASLLSRWFSPDVPGALLAVPISIGTTLAWTMAGLILGSLYEVGGFESRRDVLGSPSGVFTLIVAALAWFPLPPLVIFFRRYWWLWLSMSAIFVALFGWVLPLLASG
ncbi:MAG: hypothetical protein HY875_04840 [Chloroflexi bacterium]|nr:hypothetical protein [Chloroflexota bacterium]